MLIDTELKTLPIPAKWKELRVSNVTFRVFIEDWVVETICK